MVNDGERTTISSRVAELDQIMPQYLGVSEAILDSVIFCHQDESLWPMSEPGVLKKKFDEIFAAMKYTKAIDNIKNLRKAQAAELVKHKMLEDQFKTDKDRGERAEKRSLALQAEIENLREQSEQLNKDMQTALDRSRELRQQAQSFLRIINDLKAKRDHAAFIQANVDELKENLQEINESDEWLASMLAQYEEQMAKCREEQHSCQVQYGELQEEIAQARRKLAGKLAEQGQHQAQKEYHEKDLEKRSVLIKEAALRHSLRGYDGDLDDARIQDFMDRVNKLSREKDRELERVRKAIADELGVSREALAELELLRSTRTQDKVQARQLILDNDRKMKATQHDVDQISIDEGTRAVLESSRKDLRERLDVAVTDLQNAAWDRQLQSENTQLRSLEEENDRLNEELFRNNRLAESRVKLELLQKELKDKQQSLDTMVETYREKFAALIGEGWQVEMLESEFQDVLDQRSRLGAESQRQRDIAKRELDQIEFKLLTARSARKKRMEELKACETAVLQSIYIDGQPLTSTDDYPSELATMERDRDTLKSDVENFTHLEEFYNKCVVTAEQQNKCRLCERKFSDAREKSSAITKLRQRLASDNRSTVAAELTTLEKELKEAQAARAQYEAFKRLSEVDIPSHDEDINRNEKLRDTLLVKLEEQDVLVQQRESSKREVEALSKTVSRIVTYLGEISSLDADVSALSTQQKSGGSTLSLADIQQQSTTCAEQIRTSKARISKMSLERERMRSLVNTLELELRDAANKLDNAEHQMSRKRDLMARIAELKESTTAQHDLVRRADVELDAFTPKISQARARYTEVEERGRGREREIREEGSRLSDTFTSLRSLNDAIASYYDNDGPGKLASCHRAIKAGEQEIARLEDELSQITVRAKKLNDQLSNSEGTKRTIADNIKFRQSLHELEGLHSTIEELESREATEDYKRLDLEATRLDMRHQKLLAERGPILGTMRAKDDELQRLLAEWEADYKDAARKYREAHIKVETTKAAIEDLQRYGTALDQAIMKYHSLKMQEINRIAGELWQSTYQGTDVDTILIRSDAENTSNKRNFNYRVCMVKQDAEMDMRGRCSAGQRVLASIIIRLALAECFGVNCGVSAPHMLWLLKHMLSS
jgi:DNA repair protein RAD50